MSDLLGFKINMNNDYQYKLFEELNTKIIKIEGRIKILEQNNKELKQENTGLKQEIIKLNNRLDK